MTVQKTSKDTLCNEDHTQAILASRDVMELLSGKWKIAIIATLSFEGKKRFMDLSRAQSLEGIGAKILSKELHNLESNQLITRTVCHTKPITVEYEITEYGKTLNSLITEMIKWGLEHRKRIMTS